MSTIASDIYASLGLSAPNTEASDKKADALGQADFLRLMTEQLQHQDPLKPMENSAFLGQLAQFSTVQGITDLNTSVQGFSTSLASDQIMRGAALVGHQALVPSASLALGESGGVSGMVAVTEPGSVGFRITDANGQVVRTLNVGADTPGEVAFAWDGTNESGQRLPAGRYGITATHTDAGGEKSAASTYVQAKVQSVSVGSDGLYLDLEGLGTAPIDYVLRIS